MNALSFRAERDECGEHHQLPERQRDWYEFRRKRKVLWRPRKSELQYIGSIHYSFDHRHAAVGSFRPDRILDHRQFPTITQIDQSILSALSERRIVWTPNYRAEGNIDRTEWKAYYLKVCSEKSSYMPTQVRYEHANDVAFDIFDVTADTQRIKLYIARSLRDLYYSASFEHVKLKHHSFKVSCSKKTIWRKTVRNSRKCNKVHNAVQSKQIMAAIENNLLTQDELNAYINGRIQRDDIVKIIRNRAISERSLVWRE